MKYKVWHVERKEWISDMWNIYMDPDGEVYEIEERSLGYQTYTHKEQITEKVEVVYHTGLKDKNGTEIYEGDAIKYHAQLMIVRFGVCPDNGVVSFFLENTKQDTTTYVLSTFVGSHCEVIGNIFENSNLLSESK